MTPTTTLKMSERLKAAGVPQGSYFSWVDGELWDETMQSDYETRRTISRDKWICAFTLLELIGIWGKRFESVGRGGHDGKRGWWAIEEFYNSKAHNCFGKDSIEAVGNLLLKIYDNKTSN